MGYHSQGPSPLPYVMTHFLQAEPTLQGFQNIRETALKIPCSNIQVYGACYLPNHYDQKKGYSHRKF